MLVWRRRLRGKEIHPQFQLQIVAMLFREIGALFALISVTEQIGIELQFVCPTLNVVVNFQQRTCRNQIRSTTNLGVF